MSDGPRCRFDGLPLRHVFVDLGVSPLANSYVKPGDLGKGETFYPLRAYVSERTFLVQLEEFEAPEAIFSDYAYFSSFSDSWLDHARAYVEDAVGRFRLDDRSQVVEIASNDGYLLQYFAEKKVPVLGIEPARNVAAAAIEKGIPTQVCFFGADTATRLRSEGRAADLIVANNVLAHAPNVNDFVAGIRILLRSGGRATLEFPHLLRLAEETQFDTIYHEHFFYFSLLALETVFAAHGLAVFDVEELSTHGGSLRLHVSHASEARAPSAAVARVREAERAYGLDRLETYFAFGERVHRVKRELLTFLIGAKERGERVVGYGAPAKGNTLLNYCGIRSDLLDFTVDRSPHKQGTFLPGTRIPVFGPDAVREARPDYLLILPWNLKDEIAGQMSHIREWGGRFVTPIPRLEVF